jgi:hypothetical protein
MLFGQATTLWSVDRDESAGNQAGKCLEYVRVSKLPRPKAGEAGELKRHDIRLRKP